MIAIGIWSSKTGELMVAHTVVDNDSTEQTWDDYLMTKAKMSHPPNRILLVGTRVMQDDLGVQVRLTVKDLKG